MVWGMNDKWKLYVKMKNVSALENMRDKMKNFWIGAISISKSIEHVKEINESKEMQRLNESPPPKICRQETIGYNNLQLIKKRKSLNGAK